uniref:Endonuclease/exonuclease/phosphatase domain-containing protein n=1 Tax=Lygus hesperus TaxID=30085 RepID=A0A0A9W1M7_LYGHE
MWNPARETHCGLMISKLVQEFGYVILNTREDTHIRIPGTSSDVTISDATTACGSTWTTLKEDPMRSDHFPIIINLSLQWENMHSTSHKWNTKSANWDSYSDNIHSSLSALNYSTTDNLQHLHNTLVHIIQTTANELFPLLRKANPTYTKASPWWNDECARVISERQPSLHHLDKTKTQAAYRS